MLAVTVHVGCNNVYRVADGVAEGVEAADADGDAGGPDSSGVGVGAGVVVLADVQATTMSATTIVVVTREAEGRMRCPQDGV